MKILIYLGCISENAIFMQFYVILPDIPSFIEPALIGDLPKASNNDKMLAKFHFGTLGIMDTMRLMTLFELLLEHLLKFVFLVA